MCCCAGGFHDDTLAIAAAVPPSRQLLALSATYSPASLAELRSIMGGKQQEVLLSAESVALLAVRQCYKLLPAAVAAAGGGEGGHPAVRAYYAAAQRQAQQAGGRKGGEPQQQEQHPGSSEAWLDARVTALLQLLAGISFQQAVVFCKYRAGVPPGLCYGAIRLTETCSVVLCPGSQEASAGATAWFSPCHLQMPRPLRPAWQLPATPPRSCRGSARSWSA
jgi:hypothetical protein